MKLVAGNQAIIVNVINSDQVFFEGSTRPCFTFDIPESGITGSQISALKNNPIQIYDDNGCLMGTHENYNHMSGLRMTLVQVQDHELTIADLKKQIQNLIDQTDKKVEAAKAEVRREMTDALVQKSSEIEKAVSEQKSAASSEMERLKMQHREEIEKLKSDSEVELESIVAEMRSLPEESSSNKLRSLAKEESSETEWKRKKRYISGDIVDGYIALKYNRDKNPEENLGTYWMKFVDANKEAIDWDSLDENADIDVRKIVSHNGELWTCISRHLKSQAFEPVDGSTKWEMLR